MHRHLAVPRALARCASRGCTHARPAAAAPPPSCRRPGTLHVAACSSSSADASWKEWGLDKETYARAGGVRVRQHVNPLKRELQVPAQAPEWAEVFEDPALPLQVDIGCGAGRYVLAKSQQVNDRGGGAGARAVNFLGMDIRGKLVARANRWAGILGQRSRLHYMEANGTVSLENVVASYPGQVTFVSVQFPDPHFKKRHHKRRIVQDGLVAQLSRVLEPGACVFLQSDVHEVAEDMRARFDRSEDFALVDSSEGLEGLACAAGWSPGEVAQPWLPGGWLTFNPTGIPTEREVHAEGEQGCQISRVAFTRR